MVRMGWYRPVPCKTLASQEVRALLVARKQLQAKLLEVGFCIRGLLRGFGLKMGVVTKAGFEARVRALVDGQPMLRRVADARLAARAALRVHFDTLHRQMPAVVREDPVCHRLMTVPGVGARVAVTFKSAVDDPGRFTRSKAVGAHFGLTPKKYQSGATDSTGGISRVGDALVRTALYEAANAMLGHKVRFSSLKRWAMEVATRRGQKRAKVALARKLAACRAAPHVGGRDRVPMGQGGGGGGEAWDPVP